eukprot:5239137-Pleurochrysis_carterae.AAC.6
MAIIVTCRRDARDGERPPRAVAWVADAQAAFIDSDVVSVVCLFSSVRIMNKHGPVSWMGSAIGIKEWKVS